MLISGNIRVHLDVGLMRAEKTSFMHFFRVVKVSSKEEYVLPRLNEPKSLMNIFLQYCIKSLLVTLSQFGKIADLRDFQLSISQVPDRGA